MYACTWFLHVRTGKRTHNLAHIPSGLYLVLATTTSGRAFSGKLLKA